MKKLVIAFACATLTVLALGSCMNAISGDKPLPAGSVPDYDTVITVDLEAANTSYESGTFEKLLSTKLPNYPIDAMPAAKISPTLLGQMGAGSTTNTHIGSLGFVNFYLPIKYIVQIDANNICCVTHEQEHIEVLGVTGSDYYVYRVFSRKTENVEEGRELIWSTEDYVIKETPKTCKEIINEYNLKIGEVFEATSLEIINGKSVVMTKFNYLCNDGVVCLEVDGAQQYYLEEDDTPQSRITDYTIKNVRTVKFGEAKDGDPIIARMKNIEVPSVFN
ncbi:MAG: hypothetical protein J5830_04665 [Clostridia bacterium]|nr:hypothetical protein [Clostridia bacterium]